MSDPSLDEVKMCNRCRQDLPISYFGEVSRYHYTKKGNFVTKEPRSECLKCSALGWKERPSNAIPKTFTYLMTKKAPLNAALRLLQQNPEAMAELTRRFRIDYSRLLEEERVFLARQYMYHRDKTLKGKRKSQIGLKDQNQEFH